MAVMLSNWNALQGKSVSDMTDMLSAMVAEFVTECTRKNVPAFFRIHHDGDFFSMDYANAWANVCKAFPDVTFWVYTRSFTSELNVIPALVGIDNLAVYVSVDMHNKTAAFDAVTQFPEVKIAMLADTFLDAKNEIAGMRDDNAPGAACPELTKQIPLISEKGGACFACGLCPRGKADIRFAIKKR